MKKILITILLFCILSTNFTPLFGMKRARTFFSATKPFITKQTQTLKNIYNSDTYSKTWRGAITGMSWGLAYMPLWNGAYTGIKQYLEYEELEKSYSVPNYYKYLVQQELKKLGIQNTDNIEVKQNHWLPQLLFGQNAFVAKTINKEVICVDRSLLQRIFRPGTLSPTDKFLIGHEGGHIKHNHILKSFISALIIPDLTLSLFQLINPIKPLVWWKHLFLKPLYGLLLGCTNIATYQWYKKHHEWQADEAVENNIETLKAAESYLNKGQQAEEFAISYRVNKIDDSSWKAKIHRFLVPYILRFEDNHPASYKRAARFRERWQALEKEQQEQKKQKQNSI